MTVQSFRFADVGLYQFYVQKNYSVQGTITIAPSRNCVLCKAQTTNSTITVFSVPTTLTTEKFQDTPHNQPILILLYYLYLVVFTMTFVVPTFHYCTHNDNRRTVDTTQL
jgi:hypothetical protein